MDQWPFIVLIVSAVVLFASTSQTIAAPAEANALNSAGLNYIAQYPWESGFPAAVDAVANGFSLLGKLASTGASRFIDSTTHGAGMLLSGTLGSRMVNVNTRHFSDMFGQDSANPFAATGSNSNTTPSKSTSSSNAKPASQSGDSASQPAAESS